MSSDDPFFNSSNADKTVIVKPTPGRQQTVPPSSAYSPQPDYRPAAAPVSFPEGGGTSSNALTDQAAKLFALIGRLKSTTQHNDVESLHRQTIQTIKAFENNMRSGKANLEIVLAARYALCATIDETVLNTPWGSNSLWSNQSMLSTFHQETSGGEKFFLILDRIRQQPAQNLELLELMFTCLSLGFEGKYRIMPNGHSQVEALRDDLYQAIRSCRGDYEHDLSPRWSGIQIKTAILRQVPIWVIAAFTAAVLVTIYAGFNYMLYQKMAPAIEQLESVNPEPIKRGKDS